MNKTDTYIEKINVVMDYIETNLEKSMTVQQLAGVACLSTFHFHRVFHAFTGESLYAFITRLRVERAGIMLLTQRSAITEIAFACGFNDSATFARAFKQHFGESASTWRTNSKNHQDTCSQKTYRECTGTKPVKVRRTNIETWQVAYYRYTGAYAGDSELFALLFERLMTWATTNNIAQSKSIVVYHDAIDITEDDKLRLSIGMVVPEGTAVGGNIGHLTIQGDYLICRYELGNDEYGQAWQQVYRQLIPECGLQPAQGYAFECYSPDCYDQTLDKTTVEICVPVQSL